MAVRSIKSCEVTIKGKIHLALSGLNQFSYNGYTASAFASTSVRAVPQYDQSGRVIVYVLYTIGLVDYVKAPDSVVLNLDDTMNAIRLKLMESCGELSFYDHGAGTISVNTINNQGPKDVLWGPKPRGMEWSRIVGRDQTAKFSYSIETAIPECDVPSFTKKLLSSNYTISFDVDANGTTKRTISGEIKIPLTKIVKVEGIEDTVPDNIEKYFNSVVPPTVQNMRRNNVNRSISPDRTTLTYSVTDTDIRISPPPGIIDVQASHSVFAQGVIVNSKMWDCGLSATYTVSPDQLTVIAHAYFFALLKERFDAAKNNTEGEQRKTVMLKRIQFGESIYSTPAQVQCSASWQFLATLKQVLKLSGLYTKPNNSAWTDWNKSFSSTIMSMNGVGFYDMKWRNDDEKIINLCSGEKPKQVGASTHALLGASAANLNNVEILNEIGDPGESWIDYRLNMMIEWDDQVVVHVPLPSLTPFPVVLDKIQSIKHIPTGSESTPGPVTDTDRSPPNVESLDKTISGFKFPYKGIPQTVVTQRRAQPVAYVTLTGAALRAGYQISYPVLENVGGQTPIPCNKVGRNFFYQGIHKIYFGLPVYRAIWKLTYVLPGIPSQAIGSPEIPFV